MDSQLSYIQRLLVMVFRVSASQAFSYVSCALLLVARAAQNNGTFRSITQLTKSAQFALSIRVRLPRQCAQSQVGQKLKSASIEWVISSRVELSRIESSAWIGGNRNRNWPIVYELLICRHFGPTATASQMFASPGQTYATRTQRANECGARVDFLSTGTNLAKWRNQCAWLLPGIRWQRFRPYWRCGQLVWLAAAN